MADGSFTVMADTDKPFTPANQSCVNLLESIVPAEKAQAVPKVLIWEVNPDTGLAMRDRGDGSPKAPLSLNFVAPPRFGGPVNPDFRYRERPPVSIERVSVKSRNPRGLMSYQELELTFTVHRPDVIYEDVNQTDRDVWATLIIPGRAHAIEYGWSASAGVKNGILNGEGFSSKRGQTQSNNHDTVVIEGRRQLRFLVVNYSFTILPDNQIRFMVQGIEMGEFNLRQAFLVPPAPQAPTGKDPKQVAAAKAAKRIKDEPLPYASNADFIKKLSKLVQNDVASKANTANGKKTGSRMVEFGKLLSAVFIPQIRQAYKEMGIKVNGIFIGRFNKRTGSTVKKYGGKNVSSKPISEFTFPLDEIQHVFTELMKTGERLTVLNFLTPFLRLFENETIWDRSQEQDANEHTIPMVNTRAIFRRLGTGEIEASFFIFDVYTQYVAFTPDDSSKIPEGNVTREKIYDYVVNTKHVPYVSFVKANSYVKEPTFQVVQDERMKAIFVQRNLAARNREQITNETDVSAKLGNVDPRQLFSASIQGDIVMLGNFVFDVFQLIWIDFGVPQWDGPFNIMEREDVVEAGDFTTRLRVQSTGQNPFNQTRKTTVEVSFGQITLVPTGR